MASIRFVGVGKSFGRGAAAVANLSLDVPDGECMVLVGASGCGKTTTLRLAAGLEKLTSGMIYFDDRPMNGVSPRDRDVAMVFQNAALYPHMTAFRNMAFPLQIRKRPRAEIEGLVRQTAARLGVAEVLDRRPHELSGGQQQRVALGKAIVRKPGCFLFDEPLANVDPQTRLVLRALMKSLLQELRITTIHVTHDHEEAMALGDRIAVMHAGRVLQSGAPMEVYRRPASRRVAAFLGAPTMNFVPGRVMSEAGRSVVDAGEGFRLPLPAGVAASGDIVIGFRPQDLKECRDASTANVRMTVTIVEPLGDVWHVHGITARGDSVMARLPASGATPSVGSVMMLSLEGSAAHFFEPGEDGRRLG